MEPNKILNADILDILFEGKNKAYGAYQLRKTYNSRMLKAIIAMGSLLLLIFLSSLLLNAMNRGPKNTVEVMDTELSEVKKDEPPPPPPPPPPPTPPPPPEIKQVLFTPPVVKKDNEVKPDEKPPDIKEDEAISTKTVETDNTKQIVQAPVEVKESKVIEAPPKVDEDQIFTKVEKEADFPGGPDAFHRYLLKNLNPQTPEDNSAPPATYTVVIRFVVSKNGALSDFKVENDPGFGMAAEAIRILKKSPAWTPALQNGTSVNAYRSQPFTWVVAGDQ